VQSLARAAISQKFSHHYRGFFGRMRLDWERADPQTVKGLLYAYRSALTGVHLLHTGECVGDVARLAPLYGFPLVADLVARKAAGTEDGAIVDADRFRGDLERLESSLETARADSRLPPEPPNAGDLNASLVEVRRQYFE